MTDPDPPVLQLGEGFADDAVVVLIDGRVVWEGSGVSTNWSVGLADVVRLPDVPAAGATIEVRARGAVASARLGPDTGPMRASLDAGGALTIAPAPPGDLL